jgi:sialate O-acetylesterase
MTSRTLPFLLAAFAASTPAARGEVTVAHVFNEHMVLPRDVPVPVWGRATAGEKVTVEFAGQKKSATAGEDGSWLVTLDALPAAAEPKELMVNGSKTGKPLLLRDVLVGEVWLASGQSNMATGAGPDGAKADTPLVRFTAVETYYPGTRPADLKSRCRWRPADAASAGACSGTALYFARKLQAKLGVPVGLVVSAAGGSRAEAWTRRAVLDTGNGFGDYRLKLLREAERYKATDSAVPSKSAAFTAGTPEWLDARLGGRFNGMIAPLAPFAFRGVLWYQGEDNARDHAAYAKLLPALITDWRKAWGRELPFLIVQLPAYNADRKPDGTDWAAMREAQARVARTVRACGLAVTVENPDPDQLHPKNKPTVGDRLALVALKQVYSRDVTAYGPTFDAITVEGQEVRVRFREVAGGLVSKTGRNLKGFTIAAADGRFVPADARIDGDDVVVSAAGVLKPVAVRYAWANAPAVSLFNAAGLPAPPFRSDDW